MIDTFRPLRGIDLDDPWADVRGLPDETLARIFGGESLKSVRKSFARLEQLPMHDPRRSSAEAHLKPQIRAAVEEANKFYDKTLTPELDIARDAGVLEVDVDEFELDDESEEHVAWFRERLRHAWEDPTGTVMLDPRSKRLLRQEPGQASSASPDRSKRAAVGAGFVSHLPTFPSAPMAHVLEARDELADGRADYRRCVRELSEKLVSSALDESLDTDIAEYWNDALLPAMNNLRTGLQGTRLVRGTARRLFGDWAAALRSGGPAITVGLLAPHDLRSAAVSGAGAAAAYVIGTAIQQAQDQQAEPKARELVYLNGIERSLSRSRG
ncbi:hypothetical protein [Yimella sp. cx-51]|uniref:hypothetical protein n=1 Tax=Yimella sp. cx-51 TaxID=2770551 RepID=UPI00165E88D1|nr:hypothetical protein [Yimella sp. cx-51]MBC9958338.1 hypothetical protein [Yimella sp. cx-51]QTH39757.1 hypothetical protein J5M86_15195 [Yimella sp. cx-51]